MSLTHYQILGVNEMAGNAQIKRRYYQLSKQYHPDRETGDLQKMMTINEAYRVLSSQWERSAYDRKLTEERRKQEAARTQQTPTPEAAEPIVTPYPHYTATTARPRPAAAHVHKKDNSWSWLHFMLVGSTVAVILFVVAFVVPWPQPTSASDGASSTPTIVSSTSADNSTPSFTNNSPTNPSNSFEVPPPPVQPSASPTNPPTNQTTTSSNTPTDSTTQNSSTSTDHKDRHIRWPLFPVSQ